MLRRLYDWTLSLARSRHALCALTAISFAESSFFPIPPDALLVAMCLADRTRCRVYALSCTIASVVGGLLGYAIGHFLMETAGDWIVQVYGYQDRMMTLQQTYQQWGLWIILIKGLTPIPYKLVTITSGAAHYNLLVFILASVATRGTRFFLIAELLRRFGAPIQTVLEKRLALVTWVFLFTLVGGFLLAEYVVPH